MEGWMDGQTHNAKAISLCLRQDKKLNCVMFYDYYFQRNISWQLFAAIKNHARYSIFCEKHSIFQATFHSLVFVYVEGNKPGYHNQLGFIVIH